MIEFDSNMAQKFIKSKPAATQIVTAGLWWLL